MDMKTFFVGGAEVCDHSLINSRKDEKWKFVSQTGSLEGPTVGAS